MQRTGHNPGQDLAVLLVALVVIGSAVSIFILATGFGMSDPRQEAYDELMSKTPEPEQICFKGGEYIYSSDCPR